jgi:Tfp pilus assembly protein PilZ
VTQSTDRTKRKFRRRTVRVLVEYLSDSGLRCETATTLGPGGLFIETDSPLAIGALLKLCFRLSEAGIHHEIEGRIVWSKPDADGTVGTPGMGVEFLDRAATRVLGHELEALD